MQIAAALAVRNGECSVLGGKNIPQASQPSAAAKLFKVPVARIKDYLHLFELADATHAAGPEKQAQQAKRTNIRWRQAEQAPVHMLSICWAYACAFTCAYAYACACACAYAHAQVQMQGPEQLAQAQWAQLQRHQQMQMQMQQEMQQMLFQQQQQQSCCCSSR